MLRIFLFLLLSATPALTMLSANGNSAPQPETQDASILEIFTDSTRIGHKGQCKIEIIKYMLNDDAYMLLKFYTRSYGRWYHQHTYHYETTTIQSLDPDISDYNNDGLNDITVISANAARGANEVRRLFIYDSTQQDLIAITNSEAFPNMRYNAQLDCIDAFLVHGTSSTVFAHLSGDSLRTFAVVGTTGDSVFVSTINRKGKEKIIYKGPYCCPYNRFSNFRPLQDGPE